MERTPGGPRPRFTEEWLVAVLDSLSEGVMALDEGGHLTAANPAAEDLLGFSLTTHRYAHWSELGWAQLLDEDHEPVLPHPIEAILAGGEATTGQVVGLPDRDGPRWLTIATHRLQGEGIEDRGVVVSFQDVTDRVTAEHELQRVLGLLRDVLSATTHDLRGPLTAVQGYSQLLLEGWDKHTAEERDASLEAIVRQTRYLTQLVGDLSVVAGLEAGGIVTAPESLDVRDLAQAALEQVGRGAGVDVDVPAGMQVHADPTHVRRMLSNLVENAVKYGAAPVLITASADGSEVTITVRDAGPGVPHDFVPRLFDRFTRAPGDAGVQGSGLGLAIVAGLAERNGGDVAYRAAPGGGAVFDLRLPAGTPPSDPVHLVDVKETTT